MASQTGFRHEPGLFEICKHMFRYASRKTRYLQLIAVLAALGAGATIPCVMILWGDLANSFLRFAKHDPSYTAAAFQREISATSLHMIYIFFAKFVLGYIYMVLFTTTAAEISFNIRVKYVGVVLGQDVSTSENAESDLEGGAGQGVSEIEQVEVGLGEQLGMAFQLTSVVLSAFIISVVKQWKLGLVVSTMIPVTVITVGLTVAVDVRLETKIRQLYEVTSIMAEDALSNIRDVLASTASDDILSGYDKVLEEAKKIGIKKAPAIGVQHASEVFFVTCGYALSFWYGTQLYSAGEVSIGSILTVFFCVALANSSLTGISVQVLELTKAFSVAQKIMALIECQDQAPATPNLILSSRLADVQGCLKLQNVHFSYPSRPHIPVYTDLTCVFPAGKTTAIVGASGAGKSTVVALLERWFEIVSGSITLDGVDIRQLEVHWFRKQIGLVQQEPRLFQGSVYSNVSRGLVGTPHEFRPMNEKMQLVEKACNLANAKDFVSALPQGYNTWVGPNGNSLSGGQKQRLAIARAIISDPKILILDEATAALDAHSEEAVESAFKQVAMNRTTILITHKPSQAMKADNVLVFTRDGISESGPPETLISSEGPFASFVARGSSAKRDIARGSSNSMGNKANEKTSNELEQIDMPQDSEDQMERHHWPWMVSLFIPCLLGGLIFPAEAILFRTMVNIFIRPVAEVHNATNFWALMFLIIALIILVLYGLIGHNAAVFCYVIGRDIRLNYFQSFMSQNVVFFDNPKHSPGVLTAKLLQHPLEIEDFFCRNIPVVLITVVTILSCSILAIASGWKLGLVTVFGALAPICIAGLVRIQLGYINEERTHELYYESAGFVSEYMAAPRTVNSLCMENTLVSEYRDLLQGPLRQAKKNALFTMLFLALTDSLQICGMALAFWYGGTLLSSRRYSLAEFYTIFASVIFGAQATTKLFGFAYSFTKGKFAANHVLGLQVTHKTRDPSATVTEDSEKGLAISFRDVHFKYPPRDVQIFRGLNFNVKKGQRVAFVGLSGCGKSTILSLLERFYEPSSGEIYLAGRRIADLEVDETRRQMALVPQDHFLYRGTIRENLCLGLARPVTDAELEEACEAAEIYDFVVSLPEGFETPCGGSGGNTFSGGQRQRLIIARAFIRKPSILLLDEATSALDAENEVLLTEALMALPLDVTIVAVAHRFSTIRNFDTIFVLNQGQVAEMGAYEELVGRRGLFYQMASTGNL